MIKKSNPRSTPASGEAGFKENDTVNAKIDAYISENPKHWAYIQSMPRERLERSLVLNEIQKNERRERMKEGILAKLDMNPEMKEHIEGVIQHLPEDQREKAKINLASQALRGAKQTPKSPGVRV